MNNKCEMNREDMMKWATRLGNPYGDILGNSMVKILNENTELEEWKKRATKLLCGLDNADLTQEERNEICALIN
jgi:hypothetical protein